MLAILTAAYRRVRSCLSARGTFAISSGVIVGLYLLVWWQHYITYWGDSALAGSAFSCVAALAMILGCKMTADRTTHSGSSAETLLGRSLAWCKPYADEIGVLYFVIASWTIAIPSLAGTLRQLFGRISLESMVSLSVQFALFLLAAGVLTLVPLFATICLLLTICRHHRDDGGRSNHADPGRSCAPQILLAVAIGLLVGAVLLGPAMGLQALSVGLVFVSSGILLYRILFLSPSSGVATEVVSPDENLTGERHFLKSAGPGKLTVGVLASIGILAFVMGVSLVASVRLIDQLVSASAWLVYGEVALIMAGVSLGLYWSQRRARADVAPSHVIALGSLVLAVFCAALPAVFPGLVRGMLALNSNVSQIWLLLPARLLLAGTILIPLAAMAGGMWGRIVESAGGERRSFLRTSPLVCGVTGVLLGDQAARWVLAPTYGIAMLFVVCVWCLSAIAAISWLQRRTFPATIWTRTTTVLAMSGLVLIPLASGNYRPERAAKLLFSTNVLLANRAGTQAELLPFLDNGRCVSVIEGDRGTYTAWKHRGSQLQIRESGVPKAVISLEPQRCPQFSAEVMQAVMPLTLHDSPRNVLILGLGGQVALRSSLMYPVQTVTCVESDRGLIQLIQETVWSKQGQVSPLDDGRTRLICMDPLLAVLGRAERSDVIIVSPDQSALLRSTPYFSAEFYKQASRQLAVDGIFCQRFQFVDFGAEPVAIAVKTIQSAFADTMVVQTAPGEMLLLGTNSESGLIRAGLLNRLQTPHVRKTLAEVGWDWSMLLTLPAHNHEQLSKVVEESGADSNTAVNGRFAFLLPVELMRWGIKWQEVQNLLASHTGQILQWVGEEGNSPDVLRRLSELAGQQRLMCERPDEYWMYRKVVREQVSRRPRSLIQQVKGEDPKHMFHPDDQRRMDYFAALGEAASARPLVPAEVREVASFASPYDPLISYFLHQEAAELYARSEPRDLPAELDHRLYAVYFSSSADRSVRNVAAAIRLLVEHPEAEPNPARRWDQLSGLMQMLKTRWETRGAVSPKSSRIVLNDIEKSISALEAGFKAMESLSPEVGVTAVEWQARRQVLEKTLERPLRTYRAQLLPHLRRSLKQLHSQAADSTPPAADVKERVVQ